MITKAYGPPGCGKTTYLLNKVDEALTKGLYPSQILYSSFTKAAIREAIDRALSRFLEYNRKDFLYFGTLHSICYHLLGIGKGEVFNTSKLLKFGRLYGYDFTIDSSQIKQDSFAQTIQDMVLITCDDYMETFASWRKNMLIGDIDIAYNLFMKHQVDTPIGFNLERFKVYLRRRKEYKQSEGLLDFPDMLIETLKLNKYPEGIKLILIDEFQDLFPLAIALIKRWIPLADDTFISGDAYQCLYEFQGSNPHLFIDFTADKVFTMKQSYRNSRQVHDLGRRIVAKFKTRYTDDDYYPVDKEGYVSRSVSFEYGTSSFYLFRTNFLLHKASENLIQRSIPFITSRGHRSPLDSKVRRNVVVNILKLTAGQFITMADLDAILEFIPQKGWMKRGSKTEIKSLAEFKPSEQVNRYMLPSLGFKPEFIISLTPDKCFEAFKPPGQSERSQLRGFSKIDKSYFRKVFQIYGLNGIEKPSLELSTFHSIKGRETDRVIIDPTYTLRPYRSLMNGDEGEDRLFYVGITRAKEGVIILPPSRNIYYVI